MTAPTRPRRLHQQTAQLARPRLRNVPAMAALGRTVFARHQPDRRTDLAGAGKPADVIDERAKRQRHHRSHAGHRLQPAHHRIGRRVGRQPRIDLGDRRRQLLDHLLQRRQRRGQRRRDLELGDPRHRRDAARAQAMPRLAQQRADQTDRAGPHRHQLAPAPQHLPHLALRRRHAMGRPIPAATIRLRQGGHIPAIRLDRAAQVAIHRRKIRIRHDHRVSRCLERLRDPLAFRAGLEQNPDRPDARKRRHQPRRRRRHPALPPDASFAIHDANLAIPRVPIDGTILHGWLLL